MAGALLPAWWADEEDSIITPPDYSQDARWLQNRWGIHCRIHDSKEPTSGHIVPTPWGWSEDACRQFIINSVDPDCLPSTDTISKLRQLSHRRTSITILKALGFNRLLPEETNDPERVLYLENRHPGIYLKSPWSCSGRGVSCARGLSPSALRAKAQGIIHRQGSIIIEQGYDKITDFSSLFYSNGSSVSFRGHSIFITEPRGTYTGNILAPQEYIRDLLYRSPLSAQLPTIISRLERILSTLISPLYTGWLGIDMMTYRDTDGSPRLHPCIELNLRTTMGVAAMAIAQRIDITKPHLLTWQHHNDASGTDCLLPPRYGFALTVAPISYRSFF